MPQNKNKKTKSAKFVKKLLDEKIMNLEQIWDDIDKLDAHYGFYLQKIALACQNFYVFFA